jgi:hypothetical protein
VADECLVVASFAESPSADAVFRAGSWASCRLCGRAALRGAPRPGGRRAGPGCGAAGLAVANPRETGANLGGWLLPIMRNRLLATTAGSKRYDLALDIVAMDDRAASASPRCGS